MITAATRCCGECGKWYYGFNICPHCEKKEKEKKQKEQLKKDGKDV